MGLWRDWLTLFLSLWEFTGTSIKPSMVKVTVDVEEILQKLFLYLLDTWAPLL